MIPNGNLISYINILNPAPVLHHWHCKVNALCLQPYLLLCFASRSTQYNSTWQYSFPSSPDHDNGLLPACLFFFIMYTKSELFSVPFTCMSTLYWYQQAVCKAKSKTIMNFLQLNRILNSSEAVHCHLLFGVCHKQGPTSAKLSIRKISTFNVDVYWKRLL